MPTGSRRYHPHHFVPVRLSDRRGQPGRTRPPKIPSLRLILGARPESAKKELANFPGATANNNREGTPRRDEHRMKDPTNPVAEVRPVDNLASLPELAAKINAAHEAGEHATRRGLEEFRVAGEALLIAKKRCGHGKWLSWLKQNVRFSKETAEAYMRVARRWGECAAATNLRAAICLLADDTRTPKTVPIHVEQRVPAPPTVATIMVKPRIPMPPTVATMMVEERPRPRQLVEAALVQPPQDGTSLAPPTPVRALGESLVREAAAALRDVRQRYGEVKEFETAWREIDRLLSKSS